MSPRQKHKRTRTGCGRCRAQHRKCDEGKPRCKRCADANSACKYATTHVSFKANNSLTLPGDSGMKPTAYRAIEFRLEPEPRPMTLHNRAGNRAGNECAKPGIASPEPLQKKPSLIQDRGPPLAQKVSLSPAEIELLKFYSHHVAPWLDIYDERKTFGKSVIRLAMNTPPLLEGLLQLSAACANRPSENVSRRQAGISHFRSMMNPPSQELPAAALENIGCFAMARTLLFVDKVPDTWELGFHGNGAFLYFRKFEFSETAERDMWLAFLILLLRLEVAYCLMHRRAPILMPELISHILDQSDTYRTSADPSRQMLYSSLCCIKLLIDAMIFAFSPGEPIETESPAGARIVHWTELIEQLRAWHDCRPFDFAPLFESEAGDGFPAVLFSNGAAVSSSVLYHTAMSILLSCKPPESVPFSEALEMGSLCVQTESIIHHVRRVCGIAIYSESGCWDPLLIAAFVHAARQTVGAPEQRDILQCLRKVRVAGWRIDSLIENLGIEWLPID
ncbi:hypothetical protein GGS20DRAFT_582648 [Poronia punctata]|nr:hypothetical protein GGS20DRAFT_582648 [Poronia punctata]